MCYGIIYIRRKKIKKTKKEESNNMGQYNNAFEKAVIRMLEHDYADLLKIELLNCNGKFSRYVFLKNGDCPSIIDVDQMIDMLQPVPDETAEANARMVVTLIYNEMVKESQTAALFGDDTYILNNVIPVLSSQKEDIDIFVPFMDMKITFMVRSKENPNKFFTVDQSMTKRLTGKELFNASLKNAPRILGSCLHRLSDVITFLPDVGMKLLTSSCGLYGSAAIIYGQDKIKLLAKKEKEDIIIAPSNIHGCILVPIDKQLPFEIYNSMFDDIAFPKTGNVDAPSDHVYVYVRNKDIIVTDKEYQEFFSFK